MNYKETGRVSQTVCTGLVFRIFVSIKYLKNIRVKQAIDRVKIKVSNFSQNGSFKYAFFLNNKIEYKIVFETDNVQWYSFPSKTRLLTP